MQPPPPIPDNLGAMGQHALSLFERAWSGFTASLGNTTLGFVAPFLVPVVGFTLVIGVVLYREGAQAVGDHIRKTLRAAFFVGIAGELFVYGPIFSWQAIHTVYLDHMQLARARDSYREVNLDYAKQIENLKKERASLLPERSAGPPSQPQKDGLAELAARKLSLKKRLVALSREVADFNEEWQRKAPHMSYYKIDDIDAKKEPEKYLAERVRQQAESLKRFNDYDSKAGGPYAERFRSRVLALCREAIDLGLNIQNLDRVEVVNGLGFAAVSQQLAALAEKL
jgi:hypothetical protein